MKKEGNLSRDDRCEGKERWPWQAVEAPIFCSKAAAGFVANCLLLRCQALPSPLSLPLFSTFHLPPARAPSSCLSWPSSPKK